MSDIRKDLVRDNWVVIATGRAIKPTDLPVPSQGHSFKTSGFCPFCEGNEGVTPPEILANRIDGSKVNGPGWTARTIPNKFSAFSLNTPMENHTDGIYSWKTGFGVHEVILETPEHDVEFHQQSVEKISEVLQMIKDRHQGLTSDNRIKYIQTYKNKGLFAGASLGHSHMQIVALPDVPNEFRGAVEYAKDSGRCLFCEIIKQESMDGSRLIYESDNFIVLCPFAARFCYETWILPKYHAEDYASLPQEQISELALVLKTVMPPMVDLLNNPSYNLILNTAPVNVPSRSGYHWYIEIFPRLIVEAGVEIATGYHMNPVSPEWAAETLREKIVDSQ